VEQRQCPLWQESVQGDEPPQHSLSEEHIEQRLVSRLQRRSGWLTQSASVLHTPQRPLLEMQYGIPSAEHSLSELQVHLPAAEQLRPLHWVELVHCKQVVDLQTGSPLVVQLEELVHPSTQNPPPAQQSTGQLAQLSPETASQTPLPQVPTPLSPMHRPQSFSQLEQVSPLLESHLPLPQSLELAEQRAGRGCSTLERTTPLAEPQRL
jgi:hypothetical protein